MFRTVVALDVGARAVKAVVVRGAWRGAHLVRAAHVEDPSASLPERLRAASARARSVGDDLITALPGHRVSTRLLRFPLAAARRIDQAVPFELENQIPFPLDQVAVAYQRLPGAAGAKEVSVLAAAAQTGDVAAFLEAFAAAGLDPRTIDLDAAALAPLAAEPGPGASEGGAAAIVDLGATKTGIAIADATSPRFVRTVLIGGQAITRALAEGLGISEEDGERVKLELQAMAGDPASRAAHGIVVRALEPLVAEIHKTLGAYRQTDGPAVDRLLLVGGGAGLAGVDEVFGRALELPTRLLRPAAVPGVGAGGEAVALGPEFTPALALALGALGRPPRSQLNFRRGRFAYHRELAGLKRRLVVAGGLAAAIVALLGADFYTGYAAKERQYATLQGRVRGAYLELFPKGPVPANEALALRSQTEALKKELAQIGSLAGGRLTPLDILAELSRRVPRDLRIDVQELSIEKDTVRLRAETDSFESVDRIKAELLKFPPVKDVQVSDAKVNAKQTSVGFRFTIALAEEV